MKSDKTEKVEKTTDKIMFDIRCVERNVEKGRLDKNRLKKYMDSLPDAADKAASVTLQEEPDARKAAAEKRRQAEAAFKPAPVRSTRASKSKSKAKTAEAAETPVEGRRFLGEEE